VRLLALDPTIGSIDTAKNGCELPECPLRKGFDASLDHDGSKNI
jgi:hypothetical protein